MINIFSGEKKVQFISRSTMLDVINKDLLKGDTFIVSINDTQEEANEMAQVILDKTDCEFLTYVFPDDDGGLKDSRDCASIISNVEEYLQAGYKIVVHCFLGISRSGAVAKWINDYYSLGDLFLESYGNYNRSIYNSLNSYVGLDLASYYRNLEEN